MVYVCQTTNNLILSAYADDVIVVISRQSDIQVLLSLLKGLVHPKNENYVINDSPSCRSKLMFIFGTQFKIF